MNKFISVVEKYLVPVASKFAGQKHLMSIKDAFIAMLPLTLTGSFAVLFSVLLRDIPTAFNGNEVTAFTEFMQPVLDIMGNISAGTLSLMALVFAFSYAYNLAQHSNVDALPAGIIGIAIFMVTVPTKMMVEGLEEPLTALSFNYLGAGGLFTSIIFITVFVAIYCLLAKNNVTIKMPDTVPPAVAKAFAAVIPGVVSVFGSAITAYVVYSLAGMPVSDLIAEVIQAPLMQLSQGLPAVIIVTLVTQILWFFGLHGMLVLGPVYETIWGTAQIQNMADVAAGIEPTYLWVRGSFDIYGMMGGSGGTLGLLFAMFIVGKRKDTREIAKIGIGPGLFNINEPLIFGMPIVLNPIYLIPWVVIPCVTLTIGYLATIMGFAGPVIAAVPWVTPGVLSAFLATGGSIGATIVAAICLVITIVAWIPFVILNERNSLND